VVGIVPAGHRSTLVKYFDGLMAEQVRRNFNTSPIDSAGLPRPHESYLVLVEQGPKAKAKLYWPRVKHLKSAII